MPTFILYKHENGCLLESPPSGHFLPYLSSEFWPCHISEGGSNMQWYCGSFFFQGFHVESVCDINHIKWALSLVGVFKLIHPFPNFSWESVDKVKGNGNHLSIISPNTLRYPLTGQLSQVLSICLLFPPALLLFSTAVMVIIPHSLPTSILAGSKLRSSLSYLLLLGIRGVDL